MRNEAPRGRFEREKIGKASRFALIPEGQAFFSELKGRIDSATVSVRLQSFLLGIDPVVGGPIVDALEQAARRGIKVQIMADGMFPLVSSGIVQRIFPEARETNEAIERIHQLEKEGLPISFRHPIERGIKNSPFQRDHTKNIIIDGEDPERAVGFIGGRNIWSKDLSQRDFMVRVQGEAVNFLKKDFDRTWRGMDIVQRTYTDSDGNMLVSDVRRTDEIPHMIIERMQQAKNRIWLETPYYDRQLLSGLLISLRRERPDLDIRFLTPQPDSNNHPNYRWLSRRYIKELVQKNVPVFAFQKGDTRAHHVFSHAKALLIDDEAIFGSSNFSARHTFHNLDPLGGINVFGSMNAEIEIFTKDPDFVKSMEEWFESGFVKSEVKQPEKNNLADLVYRTFRKRDRRFR